MTRYLILLALVVSPVRQDETDIDRWIADLGHEQLVRREEAQGHLAKAGEKALPALKKALESKDAEKVARLRRIIDEIERPIRERLHDAEQRRLRLALYTVEFKETRAEEVFKKLGELLGKEFKIESDPDARITYSAKQAPLQQMLDAIEDRLDVSIRRKSAHWEVWRLSLPRKPRAYAPGLTFDFTRSPHVVDGKTVGTRLKLVPTSELWSHVDGWEVSGSDGKPRTIRRCDACGPLLVLAEGETGVLKVRLKGRIIWRSTYVLQVSRPEVAQSFRVGDFTIAYDYPRVTVSAPAAVPRRMFPYASLEGKLKPGIDASRWGGRFGGRMGGGKRDPSKWCDCPPGKVIVPPEPEERVESEVYGDSQERQVADYESMTIHFSKRIEESFEAEAVLPAD